VFHVSFETDGLLPTRKTADRGYVRVDPRRGGDAWYWHLLVPEMLERGLEVVAVDLPADDDSAGLSECVDAVIEAIGDRTDLVLVAQSLGGFTSPLVCERVAVDLLVMLNAMVPSPGEWWANTGHAKARAEQAARDGRNLAADEDLRDTFFHDLPAHFTAEAWARGEPRQSETPFAQPWPLPEWPEVRTRFLQGRDGRFFPTDVQRRVVWQRLGIVPNEMAGGHLVALSQPKELADRLEAYLEGIGAGEDG
jgi:pimeloyl-ACP methyl ester carboxylesterase